MIPQLLNHNCGITGSHTTVTLTGCVSTIPVTMPILVVLLKCPLALYLFMHVVCIIIVLVHSQ